MNDDTVIDDNLPQKLYETEPGQWETATGFPDRAQRDRFLGGTSGNGKVEKISARKAAKYERKAAKIASQAPRTGLLEEFNAGLGLRDNDKEEQEKRRSEGKPSFADHDPVPPRMTNSVDALSDPTNAEGIAIKKERIDKKISKISNPDDKVELGRIRDSLQEEELVPFPSQEEESGDFIRKRPKAEEFEYFDSENNKQVVRFVRYNWDIDKIQKGGSVTVSLPTYNTRSDTDTTQQARDIRLTDSMSDTPMISIMHPGMGSDPLTQEQIEELISGDDYKSIADAQLKLLDSLGVSAVNIIGSSMGAYAGLALAEQAVDFITSTGQQMRVDRVVLDKLPNVIERAKKELIKAEQAGNKQLPATFSQPFNPFDFKSFDLHRNSFMRVIGGIKWLISAAKNDPILHKMPYAVAMSRNTAEERIKHVLSTQDTAKVIIVSGTEDPVSPTREGVYPMLDRLRDPEVPDHFEKDRLTHIIFSGASHVYSENPTRYAYIMKSALTYKPSAKEK